MKINVRKLLKAIQYEYEIIIFINYNTKIEYKRVKELISEIFKDKIVIAYTYSFIDKELKIYYE